MNQTLPKVRRISVHELSIRRLGMTRFRYVDAQGKSISDAGTLHRIASLAIPPAYRDVCISADPDGHLQAVGRDARGRLQYRYHPAWRESRDRRKFRRLRRFAEALPSLRRRVDRDLSRPHSERQAVLAAIVRLLEITLARVGSDEYARANGSYGLTTLRTDHISIRGGEVRMRFPGKGGKDWSISVKNERLARIVDRCRRLPGPPLFQYRCSAGKVQRLSAADVNSYLQAASGADITARDFRTWGGTAMVAKRLLAEPKPAGIVATRRVIRAAITATAAKLGNTPTVCRKAYVDPRLLRRYELHGLSRPAEAVASPTGLRREEGVLAALLRG